MGIKYFTDYFLSFKCLYLTYNNRTISDKVYGREGNSPDR